MSKRQISFNGESLNKMINLKEVILYTDGACSGNPGPGGWGAVLIYKGRQKEISGFESQTTNNRMELTAAIRGLECLKEVCSVQLYTDSAYVCNAYQKNWVLSWARNGWRKADKKPVENQDLWLALYELTGKHSVAFHKVKGHADNLYNNRCDELARTEIKKNRTNKTEK